MTRSTSIDSGPTWLLPSSQLPSEQREGCGRGAEGATTVAATELDVAPREQRADAA